MSNIKPIEEAVHTITIQCTCAIFLVEIRRTTKMELQKKIFCVGLQKKKATANVSKIKCKIRKKMKKRLTYQKIYKFMTPTKAQEHTFE